MRWEECESDARLRGRAERERVGGEDEGKNKGAEVVGLGRT